MASPATIVSTRLERLSGSLEQPLLVTNGANVFYLTGFKSSNAALLVEPDRVRLFTDFRYREQAGAVEGVELVETPRSLVEGIARHLTGRIAFEATAMTYADWELLRDAGLELVPRKGAVEKLRAVKDEDELAKIREACGITDRVYAAMAEERFVGRPESELAWRMEQLFHEAGADRLSFPLIVGAGPTGALPHARASDRLVEANTTVVIDAGCYVDDYTSDCTRTFATGELPDELSRAYDVCSRAQEAGLEATSAGVSGRDADRASRAVIEEAGWGENYGHGMGHGVGILVHEAPVLRPESEDVLEPGNVVTVEPGIYLPGEGGVRIEDLVVVREDGNEVLTQFTKELVTVR
jgi:Xaa-Pro aminopeptidase